MKTAAFASFAGLAAGVMIKKIGDQSDISVDLVESKLHPQLNTSVDSIINKMNTGELTLANSTTDMFGDPEEFANKIMKFATNKKNHALLMKKLNADATGKKLKLDSSFTPDVEFDMRWDLTSSIGIAMNLAELKSKGGQIYERVDLPSNTFTMALTMRAPGDEGEGAQDTSDDAFKGYFEWAMGVYMLYNPLSVSSKEPQAHRRHAIQAILQNNLPDMEEAARAYSLLERAGDIKKLTDPKLFDKAVRQLLLLEKFKENPMALKRLVEMSNDQHDKNSVEPTSLAEQMNHNQYHAKSALRMALPGIALEPFTNIGFKTAYLEANTNSDPMVLDINGALIEGVVFKPSAPEKAVKNTLSISMSLGYYAYTGEGSNSDITQGDVWSTSFGSVRGKSFTIQDTFYSATPGPIGCRLFVDMSMFCGIPFFNFSPPKVCLNCN